LEDLPKKYQIFLRIIKKEVDKMAKRKTLSKRGKASSTRRRASKSAIRKKTYKPRKKR